MAWMEKDCSIDKLENTGRNHSQITGKPSNNGVILYKSTQQMTGTHQEARMTNDGMDGNGL